MKSQNLKFLIGIFTLVFLVLNLIPLGEAQAAEPTAPYFQLRVSPSTGGDDTGDAGTGNPANYNYYFVGQTFTAQIRINTNNTNTISANVIIYYDKNYLEVQDTLPNPGVQIQPGTLYETYPLTGNTIDTTNGIIRLTGYSASGVYNSGVSEGVFGTITFKVIRQKTVNQGNISNPAFVDIEFLGAGITTDSNINNESAQDILQSVEDSYWHLWPDTAEPYVDTFNPDDGATNVPVTQNLTFHFKDGETRVDTSALKIKVKKQGEGWQDYTSYASFSCSGPWGTNDCLVTVNPPGVRNWDYYTEYEVEIEDGEDKASPSQNPAGPNKMDDVEYSFTTEPDIWAPYAQNYSPVKNATGVAIDTNVSFNIVDIEGGITGTGVNLSTVRITVKGEKFCQSGCASAFLSATPLTLNGFTYGYQITVNPAGDFQENEIVNVSIYDSSDNDNVDPLPTPNIMTPDNYTFTTIDTKRPYFTDHNPAKGAYFTPGTTNITFHVKDAGRGVDIDMVEVKVDTTTYTKNSPGFTYSGDSSDYFIEIEPGDFTANKAVPIKLKASDIHTSPANATEETYAIFYLQDPGCPSCPTCPGCYCGGGGGGYNSCSSCCPSVSCPSCPSCPSCSEGGVCPPCPERMVCPSWPSCPEKGLCPSCLECPNCPAFPTLEEIIKIPTGPATLSPLVSVIVNEKPIELGTKVYIDQEDIVFEGETLSQTTVLLEIYSDFILLKTTSDNEGKWEIRIRATLLKPGEHIVYGRVIKNGEKSERAKLASLEIPPQIEKVCLAEKIANQWRKLSLKTKLLILGIILIVLIIILIVFKQIKKNKILNPKS